MIDSKILEILRCPLGKSELKLENKSLICIKCGLRFLIKEGIPVLLVDEAIFPEKVMSISELNCQKKSAD
ncbi:MAG: Trm112 family protein [Ignavibacteria bacterium]